MENVKYDSNHINGKIIMEEAGKVFLSVPYEEGWQVMVNGEETEPELLGDCFITIPLEPGEYEIALEYDPKGRKVGIIISICGLVLFVTLLFLNKKRVIEIVEGSEAE
jgi:uncharacterized membrane protein YfhO